MKNLISPGNSGFSRWRRQYRRWGANLLLPPANEICKGYVFTRVCLSAPWAGTAPRQVPPPRAGTPLGRYTPSGQVHPLWAGTPPLGRYTPWQVHPLGRYTPRQVHPPQCMLGYGQQAGGTHPTGMHSCLVKLFPENNMEIKEIVQRGRGGRPWLPHPSRIRECNELLSFQ